jgi:hypothetical protein
MRLVCVYGVYACMRILADAPSVSICAYSSYWMRVCLYACTRATRMRVCMHVRGVKYGCVRAHALFVCSLHMFHAQASCTWFLHVFCFGRIYPLRVGASASMCGQVRNLVCKARVDARKRTQSLARILMMMHTRNYIYESAHVHAHIYTHVHKCIYTLSRRSASRIC